MAPTISNPTISSTPHGPLPTLIPVPLLLSLQTHHYPLTHDLLFPENWAPGFPLQHFPDFSEPLPTFHSLLTRLIPSEFDPFLCLACSLIAGSAFHVFTLFIPLLQIAYVFMDPLMRIGKLTPFKTRKPITFFFHLLPKSSIFRYLL